MNQNSSAENEILLKFLLLGDCGVGKTSIFIEYTAFCKHCAHQNKVVKKSYLLT